VTLRIFESRTMCYYGGNVQALDWLLSIIIVYAFCQ